MISLTSLDTMNVLRFCHAGRKKVMIFTSSISTCLGSATKGSEIPEEPVGEDPAHALETGYAQSKFIGLCNLVH
jgi:thioester reductase-like protein